MKSCYRAAGTTQDGGQMCRYIGLVAFVGVLMACNSDTNEGEEPSDPVVAEPQNKNVQSPAAPAASTKKQGAEIAVWSDPKASYTDQGSGVLENGNLWLVTRREGPSGVSFSKREIDCASGTFRYMQEGDALESMSDTNDDEMGALTEGSISTLVSDYACKKHGRGGVDGV